MIISCEIPKDCLPTNDDNDNGESGEGGAAALKLTLEDVKKDFNANLENKFDNLFNKL